MTFASGKTPPPVATGVTLDDYRIAGPLGSSGTITVLRRALRILGAFALVALLAACGAGSERMTERASPTMTPAPPTATSAGLTSPPHATIDPRPVVMPGSVVLRVGETQVFIAAQQERGSFGPPIRATWSVSPTSLGTITEDGVFVARSVGTGSVVATVPGSLSFTGFATVTVR